MLVKELESQGNTLFKYRGQLPVVLLLAGLVIYYLAGAEIAVPYWTYISFAVVLLGQFIRIYAIGHASRNTSGRNTQQQVADAVNTKGAYSIVRHPLYVGNFFMWLGSAMLSQNIPFIVIFILIFWLFYERVMIAEEQYLVKKFGSLYSDWAAKVPPFIPRFSNWQPNEFLFSWKVILKREDTPVLNITLVFFLFELVRIYKYQLPFEWTNIWVILLGFGIAQMIILRFLRKSTSVLHEEDR
jgi:protein-S-isoprenylcysteine O-methyltransferase Ste14